MAKAKPKLPKSLFIAISIVVSLALGFLGGSEYRNYKTKQEQVAQAALPTKATVTRIIDGDTLELSSGKSVRLIAVNTPDTNKPFGKEAKEFLENKTKDKDISLEYETGYEKDRYGRLNAYVFADGKNINVSLVEQGLAEVVVYQKRRAWKYQEELDIAQAQAKKQQLGIWAK